MSVTSKIKRLWGYKLRLAIISSAGISAGSRISGSTCGFTTAILCYRGVKDVSEQSLSVIRLGSTKKMKKLFSLQELQT